MEVRYCNTGAWHFIIRKPFFFFFEPGVFGLITNCLNPVQDTPPAVMIHVVVGVVGGLGGVGGGDGGAGGGGGGRGDVVGVGVDVVGVGVDVFGGIGDGGGSGGGGGDLIRSNFSTFISDLVFSGHLGHSYRVILGQTLTPSIKI